MEGFEVYHQIVDKVAEGSVSNVCRSYVKQSLIVLYRYHIVLHELTRCWHFFLGLPVQPRSWELRKPSVDEL